jgi:hypothetical protein
MSKQASSTRVHEPPSSTKRTLKDQKERTGLAHILTSALLCIIARPLHAYQQRRVILTNQDHRLILHQKLASAWQDISAGRPRNCYSARRSKGGSFKGRVVHAHPQYLRRCQRRNTGRAGKSLPVADVHGKARLSKAPFAKIYRAVFAPVN